MTGKIESPALGNFDPPLSIQLGKWVHDLTYEDLPPAVTEKVKEFILDMLGCALGAMEEEEVKIGQAVAPVWDCLLPGSWQKRTTVLFEQKTIQ